MVSFGFYYDRKLTSYKYLVYFNKKNNDSISPEEEIKTLPRYLNKSYEL